MTDPVTLPRELYEAFWRRNGGVTVQWADQAPAIRSMWESIASDARRSLASAPQESGELADISAAIGTVRFMDPPDGGDVSLAEQVRRMKAALDDAESALAALSQEAEPVAKPVRWGPCSECGGSGVQPAFMSRSRECSRCDGSGSIVHPDDRGGEVKG